MTLGADELAVVDHDLAAPSAEHRPAGDLECPFMPGRIVGAVMDQVSSRSSWLLRWGSHGAMSASRADRDRALARVDRP